MSDSSEESIELPETSKSYSDNRTTVSKLDAAILKSVYCSQK